MVWDGSILGSWRTVPRSKSVTGAEGSQWECLEDDEEDLPAGELSPQRGHAPVQWDHPPIHPEKASCRQLDGRFRGTGQRTAPLRGSPKFTTWHGRDTV